MKQNQNIKEFLADIIKYINALEKIANTPVGINSKATEVNNFPLEGVIPSGFAMRYLVQGREEPWKQSWVSENKTRKVWDTPKLQYTLDGVEWMDVPTVYIEE